MFSNNSFSAAIKTWAIQFNVTFNKNKYKKNFLNSRVSCSPFKEFVLADTVHLTAEDKLHRGLQLPRTRTAKNSLFVGWLSNGLEDLLTIFNGNIIQAKIF